MTSRHQDTNYTSDFGNPSGKFRMGLLKKTISYEVKGFSASNLEGPQALNELFADGTKPHAVLAREDVVFYDDALSAPRADDTCGLAGTVYERYGLAFEAQALSTIYGNSVDASDMAAAGYVLRDGDWYRRSGRNVYAQDAALNFYRPCGIEDAFGNRTSVAYDTYSWLVESVTDAVGNTVSADNDYRYMSPYMVTDANGNRTAVDWTPLGLVSKVALMGKAGRAEGDTLDSPTEEFVYDFNCFEASGTPIHVRTRRREVHGSSTCRWLESVEYSDGAGRVVLAKAVAEPGKYRAVENGAVVEKDSGTDVRWVGSGRTVYNNAGNPVKQYEPYFSGTDAYESEPAVVETGVTPVLHYDALDRLVRTDMPDGTFSRAEFATWEQKSFDQNDTVLESSWYVDRGSPDPAGNEPANPEKRAAWLAAKHADTPSVEYLDAQGRPFYGVTDNGTLGRYATLTVFDVLGNPLSVKDAKGRVVMTYAYNSLSAACRTESMDAGERKMLLAVDGQSALGFDARGHRLRSVYDALRRPVEQWLSGNGGAEKLVGRTVYGESAANPEVSNLRGMAWKSYDQGGLVENAAYDFKGNLLQGSRQFASAYNQTIDWNAADPDSLLEPETFTTVTAYDALNRATSIRTPHNSSIPASEILPVYNEASLLEKVDVKLRGAATATNFVSNIDYDAKGQRERIQYGNGSTTGYAYDEKTFRLKRLLTTRNNGADILQDLNYTYDAAGNVAQIDDDAQQTIFFNGSVVSPSQKFEYDALYRLVKATGREHVSVNADSEPEVEGYNQAQISPQDGTAMRNYSREWEYDSVGNILSMIHKFNGSQWTRRNAYATDSNRLNSTAVGQTTASFAYNAHGSMTSMPHLSAMDWDFAEKLCHVTRGTTEAYYNYDGSGIRTRKVVVKNGVTETRLYLGGFEIWRKTVNGALDTERETLHVMDDQKRIAIVETLTVENGNRVAAPAPVQRYQLDNHLGSASLELDDSASIISYEEYYPYGDTSYRAGRNASEVSQKRYRYTGKEKDEESGLYYHGARYYACWLGRWTAADPIGIGDGLNVYMYVQGNPVSGVDPSGTGTDDVVWDVPDFVQTEEDFRNWVYDNAGAYIDGDVTVERTDDGRPIFNYNDADITVDQARRAEMETENRTFESYLGIAAGEEALGFYADLVVKGERQGGAWGSVEKGLGYTLGFFAALWTPETATQTAFILGTAGVGSVAPVGSMVQKGLALWGAYESSISVAEGATGTTSGLHTMDLASWARSGQYQGGHEMSAIQRGLSVVGGTVGLGMSFVGGIFQDNGATQWLQGGKSFSQYKSSHGGTKRLGYLQNETGTKVQRVSIEYHHAIIPQKMQRMYQLPNWLVNNRLNVWKLNTVQHSLIDPSRYRFIKASVKPNVSWFGKYNWFTRRF